VFWVVNASSEELVWGVQFTGMEVAIDGNDEDFNDSNYGAFIVAALQLRAFLR